MNRLVTRFSIFWVKSDVIDGKPVWGIADDEGGFEWLPEGASKADAQARLAAMAAEEDNVLFSD
jgi:hypothetical protein